MIEKNLWYSSSLFSGQLPQFVKERHAHARCQEQFWAARKALILSLKKAGVKASSDQLDITNHHHLQHFPHFVVSLAHTETLGAAALAPRSHHRSIGIDIEYSDRTVKTEIERFIRGPMDHSLFTPLELWCIKEASFKALSPMQDPSPPSPSHLTLKDIWVASESQTFGRSPSSGPLGHYQLLHQSDSEGREFFLALAWIYL